MNIYSWKEFTDKKPLSGVPCDITVGVFDGILTVFSPEPVDSSAVVTEGVDEQNKVSNVGTISFMPAAFGIFCASVVINSLLGHSL